MSHLPVELQCSSTNALALGVIMTFRYSSRAAQKADWAAGHKYECKAWKEKMAASGVDGGQVPETRVRLLCRILWMQGVEQQRRERGEEVPFWQSFDSVTALLDHTESGSGLSVKTRGLNTVIAREALYASYLLLVASIINLCASNVRNSVRAVAISGLLQLQPRSQLYDVIQVVTQAHKISYSCK
jgi:hypothetical protein